MLNLGCFILGPGNKYVFAYIPKAACTNWKCVLRYHHGLDDYLNPQLAHDKHNSGLTFLGEFENPWDILFDTSVPKLTCVRNPYTRCLSAYLNKVEPFLGSDVGKHLGNRFRVIYGAIDRFRAKVFPHKQRVDFECFVTWLDMARLSAPATRNLHWIPQTEIIGTGQVPFDFIARMENLENDAGGLLERIGCDIAFPSQKAVKFPPTDAASKTRDYYTPEIVAKVRRIYELDFTHLGYDPDEHPLVR